MRSAWMVLVGVVVFSCAAGGATYTVLEGESIQAVIDLASYGDTVEVAAGTYEENIYLKSGVALIGAGATVTTIDGGGNYATVSSVNCDPNTVLTGFAVINGWRGMANGDSSPTVTYCTFRDNTGLDFAGGMANVNSSPTVSHCQFVNNAGRGMYNYDNNARPVISHCIFSRNGGPAMFNDVQSDVTITYCLFSDNVSNESGGAMWNSMCEADIRYCVFRDNHAQEGGAIYDNYSSSTISHCLIYRNSADCGGGIYIDGGRCTLNHCVLYNNIADYGGALYAYAYYDPNPWADALADEGSGIEIVNSILWNNTAAIAGSEIFNEEDDPEFAVTIRYSDVEACGGSGAGWDDSLGEDGGGNIANEPLFADAGAGDFHLQSQAGRFNSALSGPLWIEDSQMSPCIDAGDPAAVFADEPAGNGGRVNMGAYGGTNLASKTSSIDGDANGDGKVNLVDLSIVGANWLR